MGSSQLFLFRLILKEKKVVIDNLIRIYVTNKNYKHFKEKGYEVALSHWIEVKSSDLSSGSAIYTDRQCDDCRKIYRRRHSSHVKLNIKWGKDVCENCLKSDAYKKVIQKKREDTCKEKYGVANPSQVEDFKNNRTETMINRYGVENYFQSEEFQTQLKNTSREKYGSDFPVQSSIVKDHIKNSFQKRYGVDNPMKDQQIKQKLTATCLDKYGVACTLSLPEVREKIKKTNLEKYGTENPLLSPEVKAKIAETRAKSGGIPTSKQQIEVFNIVKDIFPNNAVELNYPLSSLSLDVALFVSDDVKIDIEYDGYYWHQNSMTDLKRDKVVQNYGFKVLRIQSGHLIPSEEDLKQKLEELISSDKKFNRLILKDWKNNETK